MIAPKGAKTIAPYMETITTLPSEIEPPQIEGRCHGKRRHGTQRDHKGA